VAREQVVGGSARTVCANGGYTLGGGHSWMSPAYGLAVDNVLQFTVVLASGAVVNASACTNPDLFWALRGGGAGFGVLVATTYRAYAIPAGGVVGAELQVAFPLGATSAIMLMNAFLAVAPWMQNVTANGGVMGGYWEFDVGSFSAALAFNGSMAGAQSAVAPFIEYLLANTTAFTIVSSSLTAFPSMKAWHDAIDPVDATGTPVVLGSRLVPLAACVDEQWRIGAAVNMTILGSYVPLHGHMVVGGAVAAYDPDSTLTSVTPAWRDAIWHVAIAGSWPLNATVADQNGTIVAVSQLTDILRETFPASGAYWSESDLLEPAWPTAFWGDANYQRLLQVKAVVDPGNVFTCHHCVGDTSPAAARAPAPRYQLRQ
jgi:FAD/FMN-containing dehydrogenase